MTLEKNRAEFWGSNGAESPEREEPQGFSVSRGKTKWSTIDANGNLLTDGVKNYSWDAANRLISVSYINPQPVSVADNIVFQYNGTNRRTRITEQHGSTVLSDIELVWCKESLCEVRNSNGANVIERIYGRGEQVEGINYYFSFDHLHSIREMLDGNGIVHANYDYDSWGRQSKLTGDLDSDFVSAPLEKCDGGRPKSVTPPPSTSLTVHGLG
jgi:hypothetical protein